MKAPESNVVTGAFGYTGKYITRRLLTEGIGVTTLTGYPHRRNPFGDRVSVAPFNFDNREALVDSLRGATTLYNTYWIRFPRGQVTFHKAVENTEALIEAAEEAGVRRIVHVSITNASEDSPFPYFRAKGLLEKVITRSGLSHAIIRPTVIFGGEDILINNIAWFLRRLQVFVVAGAGEYRLQPVYVEDVAEMAVSVGHQDENTIVDAVGPDLYTFDELVRLVADKVHSRARIVHLRPGVAFLLSRLIGYLVNDVVITREEVDGLMSNLLVSQGPPTGKIRISDWLGQNADSVGARYASELGRHYR